MTPLLAAVIFVGAVILSVSTSVNALGGSATTVSVSYGDTPTVCGIVAGQPSQRIQCWRNGQVFPVFSNISFESISGGRDVFCGIRSGGSSLVCWNSSLIPKRLYYNETVILRYLAVGGSQICAITNSSSRNFNCWRNSGSLPLQNYELSSISSGLGFTCGITANGTGGVVCFGANSGSASVIQRQFAQTRLLTIGVGGNHACGISFTGILICRGNNDSGQINVPNHSPFEFQSLALGANHTCALRRLNNTAVCWGDAGGVMDNYTSTVSFESIFAGLDFTCGLTSNNFSVICWGLGWLRNNSNPVGYELPLSRILPGPCVRSACNCGVYPQSDSLCSGYGSICRPCDITNLVPPIPELVPPPAPPAPPLPPPVVRTRRSKGLTRGLLAFAIVGSVGAVAGICTIIYCLWTGVCFGKKKIHNSVQPTVNRNGSNGSPNLRSRSATIRRQLSRGFRRQRSGPSSKQAEKEEEFTFADLALATNNFSLENKIGAGSFGVVYKGKLVDGREVAIKRGEVNEESKKFQEKESAFDSELVFLSRLNHKHLVKLVGYCQEREERLLVYDYMKNGALFDHLHSKKNTEKSSSLLNSWKMRIKIALDAARGIEYLHNYAVPPIIHRDIKSSNILLDANWVARVSDFGLSLTGPLPEREYRPTKAAGTVGYIDPEYYGLKTVTEKSDVYGLGVVLLELLTGRRAIFKSNEVNNGAPITLVDYAVPKIMAGDLGNVLDKRVGPPEVNEVEAVELVAYTALHCVNSEGNYRPTMTDIVANLERALGLCSDSHGSVSSGMSVPSD